MQLSFRNRTFLSQVMVLQIKGWRLGLGLGLKSARIVGLAHHPIKLTDSY